MSKVRSLDEKRRRRKPMDSTDALLEQLTIKVIDLRRDLTETTELLNRVVRLMDMAHDRMDNLDSDMDHLTERVCDLEGEE